MEIEIDSKLLTQVLKVMEMRGKYCGDSGLKTGSLGEYVKVFAKSDTWRQGYYFTNASPSTFVSYYLPAVIDNEDTCVLNLTSLSKYVKNMNGDVKLTVTDLCTVSDGTRSAAMPRTLVHPYEAGLNRWFNGTFEKAIFTEELAEIELGGTTLFNAVQLEAKKFQEIITSCETVNSGVYAFTITDDGLVVTSSSDSGENMVLEYECNTHGHASISITSPIHKATTKGLVNVYFNNDFGETEGNPLVLINGSICLIRAAYFIGGQD
jgi:hypothetical protein